MIYELDGSAPEPPPRRDPRIVATSIAGALLSVALFFVVAGPPLPERAAEPVSSSPTPGPPAPRSLIAEPALTFVACFAPDAGDDLVPLEPSAARAAPVAAAPARTWVSVRVIVVRCPPITIAPPSLTVPTR